MNELLLYKIVAGFGLGYILSDVIRTLRKRRRARATTAPMRAATPPNDAA